MNDHPSKWSMKTSDIMPRVGAVQCDNCKSVHHIDGDTYISIHGNLHIGIDGGLIGNNIDDHKVVRVSIYCIPCFREIMNNHIGGTLVLGKHSPDCYTRNISDLE